mgnify:CR=1 FL=1|tara:strand:- start:23028 stop:23924 length:897 start_codon:yes stop_codon:yes gene_type:complete
MKIKLYSSAHMTSAKKIFSNKIGNLEWHNAKWTDEEINMCKSIDYENFISNPTYKNYKVNYLNSFTFGDYLKNKNDEFIDFYINEFKNLKKTRIKILSIACGFAQREFYLVKNFNLDITAIDNSPVTEKLNCITDEIEMSGKIKFINTNGKKIPFPDCHFDYVISDSLIYCLEDTEINTFFKESLRVLKKNGINIITISSRLSIARKLHLFLKKIINKNFKVNYIKDINLKQTGYMRDINHIMKFLPKNAKIKKIQICGSEYDFGRLFLKFHFFINFFSKKIFPILGYKAMFKIIKIY